MTTFLLMMTLFTAQAADLDSAAAASQLVELVGDRAELDEARVQKALERLRTEDPQKYEALVHAIAHHDEDPLTHGPVIKRALRHFGRVGHRREARAEMAGMREEVSAIKEEIAVLAAEHGEANRKRQQEIEGEIRSLIAEILESRRELAAERIERATERLEKARAELADLESRQDELVEEYLEKALERLE